MSHRHWDIDCKIYIGGLKDDANRYDIGMNSFSTQGTLCFISSRAFFPDEKLNLRCRSVYTNLQLRSCLFNISVGFVESVLVYDFWTPPPSHQFCTWV